MDNIFCGRWKAINGCKDVDVDVENNIPLK